MDQQQSFFDFAAPRLGELLPQNVEFVSFDFETTGLDSFRDRILEIGAVSWRQGKTKETFSSLVRPGIPVPPASTAVHGITDDDLLDAPDEKGALVSFLRFIEGKVAVAHNLPFDYGFLESSVDRLGLSLGDTLFVDTLTLSRRVYPGLPSYALGNLITFLNLSQEDAHRALSDASDCGRLFFRCLDEDKQMLKMTIDELITYSRSRKYKR
ncbi:3'-5' exonuclease [Sediminispirochaeta bajacaliforniensis]|uniref:3'-5' exonuclease n=1 Tax=Sediminispirochaeta bajacaliforniensis TaxID=148 RepID=UPI00037B48F4|nr:3'-5' exonuclease [Sediminispirochaeta bajacaliforniensis]